jgi:hypothetical protein
VNYVKFKQACIILDRQMGEGNSVMLRLILASVFFLLSALVYAPASQASACDYFFSRYQALMAEALANNDVDLAVRAQYWYQDYEACLAREAANPSRPPSGGSSGGSTVTPPRPSYTPPPSRHPACNSIEQPIPRGRQSGPNNVTFDWDRNSQASDYRFSTRKFSQGVWQDWSGFSSLGTATSHTVGLEPGESISFSVLIMCTGSADGKIYPRGNVSVTHSMLTFAQPAMPSGWSCSSISATVLKDCSKAWYVPKAQSKKAQQAINRVMSNATSELASNQTPTQAPLGVNTSRVEKGRLQVIVNAKIPGTQVPYPEGTFTAR